MAVLSKSSSSLSWERVLAMIFLSAMRTKSPRLTTRVEICWCLNLVSDVSEPCTDRGETDGERGDERRVTKGVHMIRVLFYPEKAPHLAGSQIWVCCLANYYGHWHAVWHTREKNRSGPRLPLTLSTTRLDAYWPVWEPPQGWTPPCLCPQWGCSAEWPSSRCPS